jgi:hypothetical protein
MDVDSTAMRQLQLNLGSFELKFANDLSAHIRYAGRAKYRRLLRRLRSGYDR